MKTYKGLEFHYSNIDLLKKEIDSYRPLPDRNSKSPSNRGGDDF